MLDIRLTRNTQPGNKPGPEEELRFGRVFTDHMFLMDYAPGLGWHDARIVPYGKLSLPPSAMVFHYGQELFEGLKAYRAPDGRVLLFRPGMNARRMRVSCARLCVPEIPEEDFLQAVRELVRLERDWVPSRPGSSLYIRPFVIATEPALGVAASRDYLFAVILSPSGPYYTGGSEPASLWVEEEHVRAAPGGTGWVKAGGNYAGSLQALQRAHAAGCIQALWLDAVHRRFVEEAGAMNVFFKLRGRVVTPALDCGSILAGVTRDSVLTLCRDWGIPAEERPVALEELVEARGSGLEEAFCTGTAAVVIPVGRLLGRGLEMTVGNGGAGPLALRLYDALAGIQTGRAEDPHGWAEEV